MFVGIDACRFGWCVAVGDEIPRVILCKKISDLEKLFISSECTLIDIPIGLPDASHVRNTEKTARRLVPRKASSFFSVPCRNAVHAASYSEAKEINTDEMGKSLSIQSWNIVPKIKEVDHFLSNPSFTLLESHPELCFHFLNKHRTHLDSKKSKTGIDQRLRILNSLRPGIEEIYNVAVRDYFRKDLAKDDILDALCLWMTASLSKDHSLRSLTPDQFDSEGLEMNMYFVAIDNVDKLN